MWERHRNSGYGFGEHNVIFLSYENSSIIRYFQQGLAGQLQQVVPAPVVCFIKSTVSVSELFRFLRLLQDGFSVVLYFQGGFVAHGYHIAVAAF